MICNATWIDQPLILAVADLDKLSQVCDCELVKDGCDGTDSRNDGVRLDVFRRQS